jgi:N-dimethylarginine dimethylaminohydrolase
VTAAKILMCPPDHYGIEYEINPWMNRRRTSEHPLAVRQWNGLRQLLEDNGATVYCLEPVAGLPDLVFTANAALICGDLAIPANFRHPERQGEEGHARQWLREHGFQIHKLSGHLFFEGAGDALFCGDMLFAGYRMRSDIRAHREIADRLGCRVISLELVDPNYYHLDTCFCPLAPGQAVVYPPAFDRYGRKVLCEMIADLVSVNDAEAANFACNAVVLQRTVITNAGCPQLHRELESRGFQAREMPLSEFVKAGGSAKCLTLRLDGEEAAAWKSARSGADLARR